MLRRHRRLRHHPAMRDLVRETRLAPEDLVAPLFVKGAGRPDPIPSIPGFHRLNVKDTAQTCARLHALGIRAVIVFPVVDPALKDPNGTAALDPDGLVPRAAKAIRAAAPGLLQMADVALDPFTTHGHDGVLEPGGGDVDNDATVAILARMAVNLADAGVDCVAPSDMMDGRIRAIREALDSRGHHKTAILAYAAKFASTYYGPFRDAVGSRASPDAPPLDKSTYQIDPANARMALDELRADEAEGADILMVKPAGPYLDIIRQARDATRLPIAAYQVSGEHAQIHAAARMGWLDLERARDESLLAIKRAGADLIVTYFAEPFAKSLRA